MAQDRIYQQEREALPEWFGDNVGNIYQISGVVFNGEGLSVVAMLPGQKMGFYRVADDLTEGQWADIIARSDDPHYLDDLSKVWLRKATRQISGKVQQKIWARDGFKCLYCRRNMGEVQLTIDHFIPLELGGEDKPGNYISSCAKCNRDKGNLPPEEYCRIKRLDYQAFVSYLANDRTLSGDEGQR